MAVRISAAPAAAGGRVDRDPAGGFRVLGIRRGWSDDEWDEFLASRAESTFFHTRAWARLILASFPAVRDESLWLETEVGPALLPLFAWRRAGGLITTLHSSFPFLYGGPISDHAELDEEWMAHILEWLGQPYASLRLCGNPLAAPETDGGRPPRGFSRGVESTHLLGLPHTEEAYWDRVLTPSKRNDVRRLGKKGVVVEESRDPGLLDRVYGFYLESFHRWGGRPRMIYPRAFYQNLLRMGGSAVRMTIARLDGRLAGGTFTVRWNGTAHYLAGYFDPATRALRPNVLIQVESILRAIRDGYQIYDFLPSGGHPSVETFKESFGGRKTPFPLYQCAGWIHRWLRRRETCSPGVGLTAGLPRL